MYVVYTRVVPDIPAAIQPGDFEGECSDHSSHLDGDEHTGDGVGQCDRGVVREDDEHKVGDEVFRIVHEANQVVCDEGERQQHGQVVDGLHRGLGLIAEHNTHIHT